MIKHTKKLLLVILFVIVIMGGSTFVYADVSVETNDSSIITQSVKENKEKADESSTVSYENVNTNQEKIELNETLACDITAKFLQSIYPEYLIDNYLSKKYYDILGKPIGYIIDCYQKDTQCAYVILDSTEKNLICEYSVGENCLDPIQQIMKNNEVYSKEDLFYKVDSLTYAVYDSISNNVYSNSSALDATTSKLILSSASQPATEWDYIMLYRNQVVVDYARSSENHLDDFIAFTENEIESATQHFACAVSALLCCSCYHGIFYGYSDYMDIWNATSTTTYDISSEGIEYGSTLNNNIGPGYVQYCNLRGRSMSQITNSNADYSFFTNMIDNGHIGIFATAITRLSGTPSKHALCVQGYSILISHSNGSVYRTLIVSDGWEYQARHILFDSSSLLWRTGIEFY